MQINENGVISNVFGFSDPSPRNFFLVSDISSLIAPFWQDVDVSRFGTVYYRVSFSNDTLSRADDLVELLFPSVFFNAEQAVIVTWFQVAEGNSVGNEVSMCLGKNNPPKISVNSSIILQSNTFQAALVSNQNASFVFFFYGDMQWGEFSNIGFDPSFISFVADSDSESFMIPIALTNETVNIETTSNTGVPGFYAFRVDQPIIEEPEQGDRLVVAYNSVSSGEAIEA